MSVIRKLDRDPIVAFHVAYAKLPGSDPVCALFLSQVSYWCSRAEDGVAWITHQAMYDQTGMSRKQQDRAAAYWESVGVMTKFIKGIPPKIHYFINYARLEQFIMEDHDGQVDVSERDRLDVPNGQHVMSERGKTSNEDSKDSQRLLSDLTSPATKQQPEKAAIVSSSLSAQTPALTSQSAAPALRSELTTPPKSARKPKVAAGPKIPTLEEFVAWAGVSHPGWEHEAEAWYKRMASQDWITSTGKPVLNAKGTFNTWIANGWINKLTPQQELPRFGSFGHRE